ncbi:MAG TPA: DUF692 family protein [Flavisolibacter sp.]|nr:DUF692 family protein [Flavisolibacter sp.]
MKYSIGTTYEGKNTAYLKEIAPFVNHIEVSPDSIAVKKNGRTCLQPEALAQLKWVQAETNMQILLHGVGLSIGSYDGFDNTYIDLLDELTREVQVQWHSEHLAYTKVNGENLGTMLALPRTDEVIDMICQRVESIQKRYKIPFLLENVITMLPPSACKYSEAAFLNRITSLTGCGLILDVYNLECDAYNFGLDIDGFLSELNLQPVVEIHLAGGNIDQEYNFKMDIHSQMVEASTLALAAKVLRSKEACIKAITFEILEEFIDRHGAAAIIRQLKQLYTLFNQNEPRVFTNESL